MHPQADAQQRDGRQDRGSYLHLLPSGHTERLAKPRADDTGQSRGCPTHGECLQSTAKHALLQVISLGETDQEESSDPRTQSLISGKRLNCEETFYSRGNGFIFPDQLSFTTSGGYSTVTDFARLRGWSTSVPFSTAT
jgi:hypothetical protein